MLAPGLVERDGRVSGVLHCPSQPAKDGGVVGQGVGAAQVIQLQQVLGLAQEAGGGGEVSGDYPACGLGRAAGRLGPPISSRTADLGRRLPS